jgi:hypothetical protein
MLVREPDAMALQDILSTPLEQAIENGLTGRPAPSFDS